MLPEGKVQEVCYLLLLSFVFSGMCLHSFPEFHLFKTRTSVDRDSFSHTFLEDCMSAFELVYEILLC